MNSLSGASLEKNKVATLWDNHCEYKNTPHRVAGFVYLYTHSYFSNHTNLHSSGKQLITTNEILKKEKKTDLLASFLPTEFE